jgi:hypothetical protein
MFAMGFTPEGWATAAAAPNSMTRDHDRSAADLIVESPAMMPITAAVRLLAPPKETWKECRRSGLMPVVGGGRPGNALSYRVEAAPTPFRLQSYPPRVA